MSLMERIAYFAQHHPEHIALESGDQKISYAQLLSVVDGYAQKLMETGCERLGLAGDNSIEWILWDLAALRNGNTCIPLPPFFTAAQTEFVSNAAGITHIAAGSTITTVTKRVAVLLPAGTCKVTFTSGSTGTPKGVCLAQKGIEDIASSIGEVLGSNYAGRHLCTLPLSILLENIAGVYSALMMGATVCVTSLANLGMGNAFSPDFRKLVQTINETKATSIILVPELLRGLMAAIAATKTRLPTLTFVAVGGAKVAPELLTQAHALSLPVYEGYGLSECASVVSLNTPHASKAGTSGKLLPHIKTRVSGGEILIENPAFVGYLGEEPRKSGEFYTGDIGGVDADGFVTLQGRRKNILITSFGRNISPEWVESHLLARPEILQAVVYGDAAPHLTALIVPTKADADVQVAIQAVNKLLPEYAHIKDFKLIPPFTPANGMLTGNGRVKRDFILRAYEKEKIMTFYERLQKETTQQRQMLYSVPQLVDGLKGDISRETYIAYLTEAFHHVKHTVRFMMAMGLRLPEEKKWLHDAVSEYIEEEKGHEEWILNDIAAAGADKEAARSATPNLETQVLVAYNYDYIARKNPVGFLGMVFMLESTSTQIATNGAESIQKALGLPKSAFSYLTSHGALDIEHMKFFEKLMEGITDPADQAAIIEVAQNTFRLFAGVLGAIPHQKAKRHAA